MKWAIIMAATASRIEWLECLAVAIALEQLQLERKDAMNGQTNPGIFRVEQ